jgi:4-amino-4-deoxy-L-arabinose transferase-like glycosyltransferase
MHIQKRQITTILLLLILLLAFGLRFFHLDAQSLWNDEGTSVAVAQRDLITITRDAASDIHPPLYYWLLGVWVRLFGVGETAVRSLSALLGVVLVALTYGLGRLLIGRWVGLAAALLAAIHPFQVYYSQEARMYMLLTVLTAGAMLALVRVVGRGSWAAWGTLVVLETCGLYTHYSFAFVFLVLNLAYALWLLLTWRREPVTWRWLNWVLSQVAVMVLYLPWLPTAIQQVTTWPSPSQTTALLPALAETWRWLVFGPTIDTSVVIVPLLVAALVALVGLMGLGAGWMGKSPPHSGWSAGLLALWLSLPVLLMLALGLYREAYLKFLLVTTPALTLCLACGLLTSVPNPSRTKVTVLRIVQLLAALCLLVPSALALKNYYADPAYARDNYRGLAAQIQALGQPGDAILLNAPGQQEVFAYYYGDGDGGLPIYPLPESRPLDPEATEAALKELAPPGARIFAVFWATDESDPERFIEGWLDSHAYKALDSWYGNVRLAVYAIPERAPSAPDHVLDVHLESSENGDEVTLMGYSLLNDRLAAGDIAQITLFWQARRTPSQRYKVFLHVLDGDNHIVGQRDAEPGGGARLTTLWEPGQVIVDRYGLPIHPATAPGEYRVEVGMYDAAGQRLTTPDGESQVWLQPLVVDRPAAPAPVAALGMQHAVEAEFGELALLGYDAYRLGFAHEPDVSLRPEDLLHVNVYWRAETQPSGDWAVSIRLVDADEREWSSITAEPVGGYATSRWQAGDVWRGQFNLTVPGQAPPGRYWLHIQPIAPDGVPQAPFQSRPLVVEP